MSKTGSMIPAQKIMCAGKQFQKITLVDLPGSGDRAKEKELVDGNIQTISALSLHRR